MRLAISAAVLAAIALPVYPQNDDSIVVTATRGSQLLRESIPHTTVITRKQIEDAQAPDLPALLRREAGFEFIQQGGVGRQGGAFLRGTATGQSLVLVDGMRLSDLNNGVTTLDQFMLDQIERVEIVRGNASSLYGSGAIGGVIQIFTRQGRGDPRLEVGLGLGGQGEERTHARYAGEHGDTRFSVVASTYKTDGFSVLRPGVSATADQDRDGYRNRSLAASVSHRFGADHEAGFSLYSSAGKQQFDSAFSLALANKQTADVKLATWSGYVTNRFTANWQSRISVSEGSNLNDGRVNGVTDFRTQTRNRQIGWQNNIQISADHGVVLGVERLNQEIEGTIAYQRTTRKVDSYFLGYNGRFGAHSVQLNGRNERYSDFGDVRTHYAGYAYDISERWRAFASSSTGFRAATFNELFFPAIDLGGGFFLACNEPLLRPERSRSAEAGIQYAQERQLLKSVIFHTRIVDAIQPGCPPQNVDHAIIDGLETSYTGSWFGADVKAALTIQDPTQHTAATHLPLLRRSKAFASMSAVKSFGSWRVGGELLTSRGRPDTVLTSFTGQRVQLAGYTVVNLVAAHSFGPDTRLSLRVENLFDRDYVLTDGFNVQKRKLSLSLNHRF